MRLSSEALDKLTLEGGQGEILDGRVLPAQPYDRRRKNLQGNGLLDASG